MSGTQRLQGAALRMAVLVIAAATVGGGCVSLTEPTDVPTSGSPSASPSAPPPTSTPTPYSSTTILPTEEPLPSPPPAGPPFGPQLGNAIFYDWARVFSGETDVNALQLMNAIDARVATEIVVYTQYKPGSDTASTAQDAQALMDEWTVGPDQPGPDLVLFWNITRLQCEPGVPGNGQVQLYASPAFERVVSDDARQAIFDNDMLPLLQQCDLDGALLAALNDIDLATLAEPSAAPPTDACSDPAYVTADLRWPDGYEWYFNRDSVPAKYDADEVLTVIKHAFENITTARNDCGLPDKVSATATYLGETTEEPCGQVAFENVVGFGVIKQPSPYSDFIAETCPYGFKNHPPDTAQIEISTDVQWAISLDQCTGREVLLEATLTHEAGHVFGLGHVGERKHGELTMSPYINGDCEDDESTLGLGDILGLEELYPDK